MYFQPTIVTFSYQAKCTDLTHQNRAVSGKLLHPKWQVLSVTGAEASKDKWQFSVVKDGVVNKAKLQLLFDDSDVASLAVSGGQITMLIGFESGAGEDLVVNIVA